MMGYHCVDIDECSGTVFSKSSYYPIFHEFGNGN